MEKVPKNDEAAHVVGSKFVIGSKSQISRYRKAYVQHFEGIYLGMGHTVWPIRYRLYVGTAPWEINFAYFLVTRTTFYALSDGSHKRIQKCLKSAKICGQSSKFRVFLTFSITTALNYIW